VTETKGLLSVSRTAALPSRPQCRPLCTAAPIDTRKVLPLGGKSPDHVLTRSRGIRRIRVDCVAIKKVEVVARNGELDRIGEPMWMCDVEFQRHSQPGSRNLGVAHRQPVAPVTWSGHSRIAIERPTTQ
jgi:hypothetical protein